MYWTIHIDQYPDPMKNNHLEYKIALRVGTTPIAHTSTGRKIYDYHFMRQTNTGQWAEKHGKGKTVLWDLGMTPDEIPWTYGVRYTMTVL